MWNFMHVHIHFPTIHCTFDLHACILSFCAHGHWCFRTSTHTLCKTPIAKLTVCFFSLWWDLNFEPWTSPWLGNFLHFLHLLPLSRQWNICCCSFWKTTCLHQHKPLIICAKCFPGICGVSKVVEQAKIRLLLVAASWPGPRKQKDQEKVSSTLYMFVLMERLELGGARHQSLRW
jgi:hypothetical protein